MSGLNIREGISDIRKRTKAGQLERTERIKEVEALADDYALNTPGKLDPQLLEKLADLCLHEELTDTTSWKSQQVEYPFLSSLQLARRRNGTGERKYAEGGGELDVSIMSTVDLNGRDHGIPSRRKRTYNENVFVDENARSKNKERARKYKSFIRVQPVETYFIRK